MRFLIVLSAVLLAGAAAHAQPVLESTNIGPLQVGDQFYLKLDGNCSITGSSTNSAPGVATISPVTFADFPPAVTTPDASNSFTITALSPGNTLILVNYTETSCIDGLQAGGTVQESIGVTVVANPVTATAVLATVANIAAPATTPADPVSLYSGEYFFDEKPDLSLGGPMPLNFSRYYASLLNPGGKAAAPMGVNWSNNFQFSLSSSSGVVTIADNHGRVITFQQSGGVFSLVSPQFAGYQLASTSTGYTLGDAIEGRFYSFNNAGSLVSIQDRNGNTHTLTYSGGNLTSVSDGLGRTLTFTYDSVNHIAAAADGTRSVTYAYTGNNLTSVTDVRGNKTAYAYDGTNTQPGLMTQKVRPLGNTATAQVWDSSARVTSQTDGAGNVTSFAYSRTQSGNVLTLKTTQTNAAGNQSTYVFSSAGLLQSLYDENGNVTSYAYDSAGRQAMVTDCLGNVSQQSYDPASGLPLTATEENGAITSNTYTTQTQSGMTFRVLTKVAYPDGTAVSVNYDANGNVTSYTDGAGNTTSMTYNSRGQMLTATNAAGGVSSLAYNADGTVASATDAAGNITKIAYDALRRANSVTDPDSYVRTYTLDAAGNMLTDTDERGSTAKFTYDANGNMTTITDPLNQVTAFGYDALDRAVSVTDPLGNKASRGFDKMGRVATETDRNGNVVTRAYDLVGNLISMTDGAGQVWSDTWDATSVQTSATNPLSKTWQYSRDALGRTVNTVTPGGAATAIAYNKAGQIGSFTDAAGISTAFSSDARTLLTGVTFGSGPVGATFAYNNLGELTQINDANGQKWQVKYDNQGRKVSQTDPLGATTTISSDAVGRVSQLIFPGQLGSVQYTYDGLGNIVRKHYSDGTDLSFTYDADARLTAATGLTLAYDAAGEVASSNGIGVTRDAGGRIISMTLAPGKVVTYAYDARNLLTKVTDWAGGVTTFTWDAAGRLTAVKRPNGVNASFGYNADDSLISISEASASATVSSVAMQRDGRGRVTSEMRNVPQYATPSSGSLALGFDADSQVSGYSYDAMGRLVSDVGRTYVWDLASRLTSWNNGPDSSSMTYDAFGLRTSRTWGNVTQNYVWNYALKPQSVSIERQNGSDLRYYVHTPDGKLLYSMEAAGNARHFYHFDETGNTLYLTDDSGNVTDSYAYTPYGTPLSQSGSTDNPFTFGGQKGAMTEPATGLYYMRARYYDAASGHFLTRDSPAHSASPNEINVYTLDRTNPMLYEDPGGLDAQVVGDVSDAEGHTDFTVDVWQNGAIIGTLNASFGEGSYRASGGKIGVGAFVLGQGTIVLTYRPGQAIHGAGSHSFQTVRGTEEQDERAARAILNSIAWWSPDQASKRRYKPGTPAGDFLKARLKDLGPTESGEARTALKFGTLQGSGDWSNYGLVFPGNTCNTFTGTMLNVYYGSNVGTGITATSVGNILGLGALGTGSGTGASEPGFDDRNIRLR